MSNLFNRFRNLIAATSEDEIRADATLSGRLIIDSDGPLAISYAPFEHIQHGARIVIVGITPGAQQAENALIEARRQILLGKADADVLTAAKVHASFSGGMRDALISMLDDVGINQRLGIANCATLWSGDSHLAHFTSALRYPVFKDGGNYNGQPSMTRTEFLRKRLDEWLREEADALPDAIWVACGPVAAQGLAHMVESGRLDDAQVLIGMPHPSGANNERIACFLGKVREGGPSKKTNAGRILAGRNAILAKLGAPSGAVVSATPEPAAPRREELRHVPEAPSRRSAMPSITTTTTVVDKKSPHFGKEQTWVPRISDGRYVLANRFVPESNKEKNHVYADTIEEAIGLLKGGKHLIWMVSTLTRRSGLRAPESLTIVG